MEESFDALEVIARTRGKVEMDDIPTGGSLFPMWGALAAFFYALEFVLFKLTGAEWCLWLWIGIPVVGVPLMMSVLRKDRELTHMRTRSSKLVLDYWIFAACLIGAAGFLFGFAGIYGMVENPLICMLVAIGAFITGETLRFRPMIVCGLAGAAIGAGAFLLQGELWIWQMPAIVATAVVSLIIPGCLYNKKVKNGV